MNKRQKKKLYKKLHGHNPPKRKPKEARLEESKQEMPGQETKEPEGLMNAVDYACQTVVKVIGTACHTISKFFGQLSASFGTASAGMEEIAKSYYNANKLIEQPDPASMATITAKALTAQRAAGKRKKRFAITTGRKRINGRN